MAGASSSSSSPSSRVLAPLLAVWCGFKSLCGWTDQVQTRSSDTAWLDGLRGVAALQVFLFHLWGRHLLYLHTFGSTPDDRHLYQLLVFRPIWAGAPGAVNVFFVISGYVLSYKCLVLMRRRQVEQLYRSLCSSVFRRPLRLFLPVLIIALPSLFLTRIFDMSSGFLIPEEAKKSLWIEFGWLVDAVDNYLNPFNDHDLTEREMPLVPTAWTIPLEFNGSLVIFMTLMLITQLSSLRLRSAIVTFLAAYSLHRGQWWTSNFLVGLLIADCTLESKSSNDDSTDDLEVAFKRDPAPWYKRFFAGHVYLILALLGLCAGLYLSALPPHWEPDTTPKVGYEFLYKLYPPFKLFRFKESARWYWYWSGNLIVLAVAHLPLVRTLLESKFCQWLGRISFALYLSHAHIITLGSPVTDDWARAIHDSAAWVCVFGLLTLGPVVFVVSGLVERFVDRPSVRWARAFEEWCRGPRIN